MSDASPKGSSQPLCDTTTTKDTRCRNKASWYVQNMQNGAYIGRVCSLHAERYRAWHHVEPLETPDPTPCEKRPSDRCDGCEAEGFRTRYCPDHTTNFCDGCWERNGCPHPAGSGSSEKSTP